MWKAFLGEFYLHSSYHSKQEHGWVGLFFALSLGWGYLFSFKLGRTSNTILRILSVRGVPPPPLYGQNFLQKKGYGFGGYPPPPLYGFFFFSEKGVTDLGGTPLPPFKDKIRKVVFEVLPYMFSTFSIIQQGLIRTQGNFCKINLDKVTMGPVRWDKFLHLYT